MSFVFGIISSCNFVLQFQTLVVAVVTKPVLTAVLVTEGPWIW